MLAAPLVVFGFLYVLLVQPERRAALDVKSQLDLARGDLDRRFSAHDERDTRDRAREAVDALTAALNGPAVGGVSNLSISAGARNAAETPVAVAFEARYEQIGRFLWNLRELPAAFDLQSIELTPRAGSGSGLLQAKMSLLVFHGPGAKVPARATVRAVAGSAPEFGRDPFARSTPAAAVPTRVVSPATPAGPAPMVTSILFSEGRRVARVDGRIVGPGDRLGSGVVDAIEPEAVVVVEPGGWTRRYEIARPALGNMPR